MEIMRGQVTQTVRHYSESEYFVSVDLAQTQDFTAICVMEHEKNFHVHINGAVEKEWSVFKVVHLERLPQGLSYVEQARYISELINRPPLNGRFPFGIDDSGVGKAVGDVFFYQGLYPFRFTIIAGDDFVCKTSHRYHVGKGMLVSMLDAKLHQQELKFASTLLEAGPLREELLNFRRHVTAAGRFQYEARAGRHDDLVLAVALALFFFVGRKKPPVARIGRATFTGGDRKDTHV